MFSHSRGVDESAELRAVICFHCNVSILPRLVAAEFAHPSANISATAINSFSTEIKFLKRDNSLELSCKLLGDVSLQYKLRSLIKFHVIVSPVIKFIAWNCRSERPAHLRTTREKLHLNYSRIDFDRARFKLPFNFIKIAEQTIATLFPTKSSTRNKALSTIKLAGRRRREP